MADRFPAEISIGGRIPRRLLDELASVVADEGVSIDWQDAVGADEVRSAIESAADQGETVRFTDDEACYGEFPELESWLTAHGIDFNRHNGARYEHDGQNVYGRGRRQPVWMNSDQAGHDLVGAEDIREILAGKLDADKKLDRIARVVSVPPALGPIVLMDRKAREKGGAQP